MKVFELVIELIFLVCMIVFVHMKADIRLVIEAGVLYLATVVRTATADQRSDI